MIRLLMSRLPRWANVLLLMLAALLTLPAFASAAATTDVVEYFKYTYGVERLLYLAAQEIVTWRIFSRKKSPVGGRGQWLMPIQTRNAGVFVGNAEGGAKTTRRAQPLTIEASFSLQEFHGIWDVTWKMLSQSRKSEFAFMKAIDFMDMSFRRRVMRLLNAELLGTGLGELGILSAADDDTTITCRALPMVDRGMIVDLMSSADNDTKICAARTVTDINVPNRTITIDGAAAVGTAAGDYFTIADSVSIATGSMHTNGLRAWLDTANPAAVVGNLGNINRSTAGNGDWQSNILSNSGTLRLLDDDLMLQLMDTIRERGGKMLTDWISNFPLLRRYHADLQEDVFFSLGKIQPLSDGVGRGREGNDNWGEESEGETIYRFSGKPWRGEMFMDANRLLGVNREHFFIGYGEAGEVPRPLSEIFGDDMTTFFTTTDNTTWEVVSWWEGDLLCDNPPAGGQITDLAES